MAEPQIAPDLAEAPGWVVLDPAGNVVDSGTVSHAQAAFLVGETSDSNEGEQD
jgi:hypothetical protein